MAYGTIYALGFDIFGPLFAQLRGSFEANNIAVRDGKNIGRQLNFPAALENVFNGVYSPEIRRLRAYIFNSAEQSAAAYRRMSRKQGFA